MPDDDDNVIRLPAEWVGPLHELVPIGKDPEPEPASDELEAVLSADDFWSEGSAAMHLPLAGASRPAAASEEEDPAAPAAEVRAVRRRRSRGRIALVLACIAALGVVTATLLALAGSREPIRRLAPARQVFDIGAPPVAEAVAGVASAALRNARPPARRHIRPAHRVRAVAMSSRSIVVAQAAEPAVSHAAAYSYVSSAGSDPSGRSTSSDQTGRNRNGPPPCYPGQLGCQGG